MYAQDNPYKTLQHIAKHCNTKTPNDGDTYAEYVLWTTRSTPYIAVA